MAFAFCLRDFAGSGIATLGSLFLQRAHQFSTKETGLALSCIYLASAISNPLFGHLSDRGRIRWTVVLLCAASVMIFLLPHLGPGLFTPALALFGFFFMASYPIVEAGLMESVPDAVRGRVFGLFITVGGLIGNCSHWSMGHWVKSLGADAAMPGNYFAIFSVLSVMVLLSLVGLAFLHKLRNLEINERTARVAGPPSAMNNPQFE
jgi:MFS family permease